MDDYRKAVITMLLHMQHNSHKNIDAATATLCATSTFGALKNTPDAFSQESHACHMVGKLAHYCPWLIRDDLRTDLRIIPLL